MFKDDDEEEDNTFGVTRYSCMPSLVALQQMRNRLHLANLGRKLMKWTALATGSEMRNLAIRIDKVYRSFSEDMRNAYILLARSRYFYPNLNKMVSEGCPKVAEISLATTTKNAAGVKTVKFNIIESNSHPYAHLGIEKGGQTIQDTKRAWLELLKRIIMMVELRTNFLLVENMHKGATKKWNVLSKLVIPRISVTTRYILSQLDEIERDDNFRLKRFKELKIKKKQKDSNLITELIDLEVNGVDEDSKQQKDVNEYEINEKSSCSQNIPIEEYMDIREPDLKEYSGNHVQDIMLHADEIINLSKRNDICDSKVLAINKELQVLLDKLLMDRLREYCKKETQVEDIKDTRHVNRSDDNLSHFSALGSELSLSESIFNVKSEGKENLGRFKKKYKESIEVLRLQNEDGTIRLKKKKVIVKTDTRNPIKAKVEEGAKQNLYCPCFKFDSESEDSSEEFDDPDHKSRHRGNRKKNINSKTESGSTFGGNFEKETKVKENMPGELQCLCPSVNLSVQSASSHKLQNININQLPFKSSTYENSNIADGATGNIVLTKPVDLSYIFKNVINATNGRNFSYMAYTKSCLVLPKFAYIFSKVNKVSDNLALQNCFDIHAPESDCVTNLFSRHRFKHTELDNLIRNACFHVNNFPYLFSRCIHAQSDKNISKFKAAPCCHPGEITVNFKFHGKHSSMLQVLKVSESPRRNFVNVNIFCSPRNISQDSTVGNYKCVDSNQIVEKKLQNDFQIATNQLENEKITTATCTLNLDLKSTQEYPLIKSHLNSTLSDTNDNPNYNDKKITTLQKLPNFGYIFSKTSDEEGNNTEDSSKAINVLFKARYNGPTNFSYIFSSYKRVEIENLLKNACSNVVSFPYIFTKIIDKKEINQNSLKLTDIKLMLNDGNKLCNCSSVSFVMSELNQIQISKIYSKNASISEYECFCKSITGVENEVEDHESNEVLKDESENYNLIECCCISTSNTRCHCIHSLGQVFKNDEENRLSYIFSKVKSNSFFKEFNSPKQVSNTENECLLNNTNDKSVIPLDVLFTNSKGDQKIKRNISYLIIPDDTCAHKHDVPYKFNKLETLDFTTYLSPFDYVRHQEIDNFFKDCCTRQSVNNNDFKYILEKVELKNKNQDNFVYLFSKVKELSKDLEKKKCPSDDHIDINILKTDCVSYSTTAFPYIFNKVQKGSPSMYASNYIEIDTIFKDASETVNDFPNNKNPQPSLCTETASLCTEITKLFKDSCKNDIDLQHKYEYLFKNAYDLNNKQSEMFNCNSKCTKVSSIQRPTSSYPSIIDCSTKSHSIISNQSHAILVKFLSYKSGSSCFGIELMLRADCARDTKHSLKNKASTSKSLLSPQSCCYFDMANTKNVKIVLVPSTFHDQVNVSQDFALIGAVGETIKNQEKLSSITRMLDTEKNVYGALDTSTSTSQETDKYLSLIDNLKSILSNSSISGYSWKSCVMKACQAEIENIEKNKSYSTFSFESSLDYVSCKSEDRVSDYNWNGKVKGNFNLNRDPITFNVKMPRSGSINNMYSRFSPSEESSIRAILPTSSNISNKCLSLSDVRTQEISNVHYCNLSDYLDRPDRYLNLVSSNSCYHHSAQFSKIIRQTYQSNIKCYCDICKQRTTETTAEYSKDPTPCSSNRSMQKCQWLHQGKCCCKKL